MRLVLVRKNHSGIAHDCAGRRTHPRTSHTSPIGFLPQRVQRREQCHRGHSDMEIPSLRQGVVESARIQRQQLIDRFAVLTPWWLILVMIQVEVVRQHFFLSRLEHSSDGFSTLTRDSMHRSRPRNKVKSAPAPKERTCTSRSASVLVPHAVFVQQRAAFFSASATLVNLRVPSDVRQRRSKVLLPRYATDDAFAAQEIRRSVRALRHAECRHYRQPARIGGSRCADSPESYRAAAILRAAPCARRWKTRN